MLVTWILSPRTEPVDPLMDALLKTILQENYLAPSGGKSLIMPHLSGRPEFVERLKTGISICVSLPVPVIGLLQPHPLP